MLTILMTVMWAPLISGQTTYAHDNLYWGYPNYHFWAESLLQGRLPLWNPFSHGGEPFYPLIVQSRLLDPNSLAVLAIGSLFTDDLVLLYNWDRFMRGILIALGAYLLLRRWADHLFTRLSLAPILLLSSFHLVNYRANGVSDQFLWAPWCILVICRMLEERQTQWRHWLLLGTLLGLNWQSYFFAGIWTFVLVLLIGVALFRRDLLLGLRDTPHVWIRAGCAGLIVFVMILPDAVLLLEKDRFIYPVRMTDNSATEQGSRGGPVEYEPNADSFHTDSIKMPYVLVRQTGSFSSIWDFIQLIVPFANRWIDREWNRGMWGHSSEAFMYFGLLVYAGALYGLVAGCHGLKRVWLLVGVFFGLLMLGPAGGLHRILFSFYPPLWFMRHTLVLALFFSLTLLYYYVIGCNRIIGSDVTLHSPRESSNPLHHWCFVVGAGLVALGFILNQHTLQGWVGLWRDRPAWTVQDVVVIRSVQGMLIIAGAVLFFWTFHKAIANRSSGERERIWLALIMTVGLAFIGLILANIQPPHEWLSGLLIPLSGLLILYARKKLKRVQLFWIILSACVLLVLLVGRAHEQYLPYLVILGGLPLASIVFHDRWPLLSQTDLRIVLAVFLLLDLGLYSIHVSPLWKWERPDNVLGFNAAPEPPGFPTTRVPFPPCQALSHSSVCESSGDRILYHQQVRYSEVLHHIPVVFTPLYVSQLNPLPVSPGSVEGELLAGLNGKRINSFLMLRAYFLLITSGLQPSVIREIFAVGQPLLQFKHRSVELGDKPASDLLRQMDTLGAKHYLQDIVILAKTKNGSESVGDRAGDLHSVDWESGDDFSTSFRSREELDNVESLNNAGHRLSWSVMGYDYNALSLLAQSDEEGFIYWSDGYDTHWRAYLDGSEVPVYRANIAFKAIRLPKGVSKVEFVYDPIWFKRAVLVFYSTFLVCLALFLGLTFRDRFTRPVVVQA